MDKYDVFYAVAAKGKIAIAELKQLTRTPQSVYYHINQLKKEKLLRKRKGLIEVEHSKRAEELFSLLHYCVANNLEYTFYFSKKILTYLKKTYGKKTFNVKAVHLNPHKFTAGTRRLEKDTFLISYRRKPFIGRILNHSFLDRLLIFHKIKKQKGGKHLEDEQLSDLLEIRKKKLRVMTPLDRIGFIHRSLMLEGNLLTIRETARLLKKNVAPNEKKFNDSQEVLGYAAAINEVDMLLPNTITTNDILRIHKRAMRHTKFAGKIRKEKVVIKNNPAFITANHKNVHRLLGDLTKEMNSFKEKSVIAIIEQAAYVHNQFQFIHPFIDGNSRTARLLLYYFFRRHHVGFHDIPLGFTTEYLSCTKGYTKRDDAVLARLLKELLLQSVE
ncbi:MAG: Fic family protein [Candidatus Woesearchaeota archaeon]|nr:Fic family protein [Candidatus Woesearchaeota archaeon]